MKKLLFMLMGIAATINAMAVDFTAKAVLTLQAESGYTCEMTLKQADEYGALQGIEMYMTGRKVALYALKDATPLQIAKAADFENLPLGLMCDASESYTITVSGVATGQGTETLVLYDLANMNDIKQYPLVNDAVINITATANSTIENRFVINYVPAPVPADVYNVTLNAYGLATFSAAEVVTLPAGLKAYTAEYVSKSDYLTLHEISGAIPANTGIILYGEANAQYDLAKEGTPSTLDANDLKPASDWENRAGDIYVLSGNVLVEYIGTEMKDNKAYLQLPVSNGAPRRMRLVFDQATGIDNVDATVKGVKFIENGQIFIRRGENIYNAQGQIVK